MEFEKWQVQEALSDLTSLHKVGHKTIINAIPTYAEERNIFTQETKNIVRNSNEQTVQISPSVSNYAHILLFSHFPLLSILQ